VKLNQVRFYKNPRVRRELECKIPLQTVKCQSSCISSKFSKIW